MEIIFILVGPSVPENIGAAARAINTMGFEKLRLVNTRKHLEKEAEWLAHGSTGILQNAQIFDTLQNAVADVNFIVATTAKRRSVKFDYYTPEQAVEIIKQKESSVNKIAIVFGREESGLTNEELKICDIAVTIPLAKPFPSVNLAQSVMVIAYIFSQNKLKTLNSFNKTSSYSLLKQKAKIVLEKTGINNNDNLYGRIMERLSVAKTTDINLFLSVFDKINNKLKD
jgi:tRNA/rRNA methyltransferase